MSPFDFALGLISIIVGVAVSDIAVSAHRLLRQGSVVKWDARVVGTCALAFLLILQLWFATWTIRELPGGFSFPLYLVLLIHLFVASLISTASLPDEAISNLGEFYEANARYFWALTTLFHLLSLAIGIYFTARAGALSQSLPLVALWTLPPIMSLVLALRPRARTLHLALIAASVVYVLAYHWGSTLQA